jgi:Ca-activated chloride channel family protein
MELALPGSPKELALAALAVALVLTGIAEWLHARRVRRAARLAFGPHGRAAAWVRAVPPVRVTAAGALAWGLVTLLLHPPRTHSADGSRALAPDEWSHVLLVLDVSPSMLLVDAGPERDQSRRERARVVLESLFRRIPLDRQRITIVAVYNGAKAVVEDTTDFEVVRNVLSGLPLQHAFTTGKTKLLTGIEEALRIARPWNPGSTTLVLVSDGDTVPETGMPSLPAAIGDVIVVGVGDPARGSFIEGRQSRQDVSALRQIAARLGGSYWNGNEMHLPSARLAGLAPTGAESALGRLTLREYALLACLAGASALALLPLALHFLGTRFAPGTRTVSAREGREAPPERPGARAHRTGTLARKERASVDGMLGGS